MDVVHQILQVCVHARLRINSRLLVCKQVVELNDANRYGFKLLSLEHELLQDWVLDHLVSHNCRKVSSFCHIPPIITV